MVSKSVIYTGFGGDWGDNGKHVNEKLKLLKGEGVKFDSKGKVLGPIFIGFKEVKSKGD